MELREDRKFSWSGGRLSRVCAQGAVPGICLFPRGGDKVRFSEQGGIVAVAVLILPFVRLTSGRFLSNRPVVLLANRGVAFSGLSFETWEAHTFES